VTRTSETHTAGQSTKGGAGGGGGWMRHTSAETERQQGASACFESSCCDGALACALTPTLHLIAGNIRSAGPLASPLARR
jgi:hypothetical protein